MNKNNEKEVIEFAFDADFYADLSIEMYQRGEHLSAIEYINRAIELCPKDAELYVMRGDLFRAMELFELSNKSYFRALILDDTIAEAYYGISHNFFSQNQIETAVNYLRLCTLNGMKLSSDNLDDDFVLEIFDILNAEEDETTSVSKRTYREPLELALALMRMQEFEEAIRIFSFIPEVSSHYVSAQNSIAFCHFALDEREQCRAVLDKIMLIDPANVFARCTRISLCREEREDALKVGDKQKANALSRQIDKYIGELTCFEKMSTSDLAKVAGVFSDLKLHKLTAEVGEAILEKKHNADIALLTAMAHYNLGNPHNAAQLARYNAKVDESDSISIYYADFFLSQEQRLKEGKKLTKKSLPYYVNVPPDEVRRRFDEIVALGGKEELSPSEHQRLSELAIWGLKMDKSSIQGLAIKVLFTRQDLSEVIKLALIDSNVSNWAKRQLLTRLVGLNIDKKIYILINQNFKILQPKYPKVLAKMEHTYREVYFNVFSSIAFEAEDFEDDLKNFAQVFFTDCKKIIDKLKDAPAVAACLAYRSKLMARGRNMTTIAAIFNAKRALVASYNKLFDQLKQTEAK